MANIDSLLTNIESNIESMFSDSSIYFSVRKRAEEECKAYCEEKHISSGYIQTQDFINESILRAAVLIAVKETIKALNSSGLLKNDD